MHTVVILFTVILLIVAGQHFLGTVVPVGLHGLCEDGDVSAVSAPCVTGCDTDVKLRGLWKWSQVVGWLRIASWQDEASFRCVWLKNQADWCGRFATLEGLGPRVALSTRP